MIFGWRGELYLIEHKVTRSIAALKEGGLNRMERDKHLAIIRQFDFLVRELTRQNRPLRDYDVNLLEEGQKLVAFFEGKEAARGNALFQGKPKVSPENYEWSLNLALLMDVHKETNDPELKKQIETLALHYLSKSASIKPFPLKTGVKTNLGFLQEWFYHREKGVFDSFLGAYLEKKYPHWKEGSIFFTDTADFAPLFPQAFRRLEEASSFTSSDLPFVYDCTGAFTDLEDPQAYAEKKTEVLANLQKHIEKVSKGDAEAAAYLAAHTICLSRERVGEACFLMVHQAGNEIDAHHSITEFLSQTGLRLGNVRGKRVLLQFIPFSRLLAQNPLGMPREMTAYAPRGPNVVYFPEPQSIFKSHLIEELDHKIDGMEGEKDRKIMALAVMNLLRHLLGSVGEEKWNEINSHTARRMLLQNTMMRLSEHLAKVNFHFDSEGPEYYLAIELALAEVMTLLSLFTPYQEKDFEAIFKTRLTHIPEELKPLVTVGLGSSAMNVYSWIVAAQKQKDPGPQVAVGENVYFEIARTAGDLDESKPVSLYVDQFYSNINISASHDHQYKTANVIGVIEKLLSNQDRLTVVIDVTIDFVLSPKGEELMTRFSKEIREGKLNLVFLASGQKFFMLAQDNYYGSVYYMINNGDEHWKPFSDQLRSPVVSTDPLTLQWFCLSNQAAFSQMEEYRAVVFDNTRYVLDNIPEALQGQGSLIVSGADKDTNTCFIELRCPAEMESTIGDRIIDAFSERNIPIHTRSSFGFLHTNISLLPVDGDDTTIAIRITPGVSRRDSELLIEIFNKLAKE